MTSNSNDKKVSTSNLILLLLGIAIVVFIITMIVIFCIKDAVPDTLIQYTLGAGGIEAFFLAAIKISKIITGEKPSQTRSDEDENVG